MSKHHRAAGRNTQHRQAIRHVLNDVPADLLAGSVGDREDAAPPAPVAAAAPAPAPAPEKGGGFLWFGRKAKPAPAQAAPAPSPPVHPGAFELERRVQRLEEALAMARDDLVAATHELGDVHQRLAGAERELGAERQTSAQWRDNASRLDEVAHALQAAHEQLQHEHRALGAAQESERQAREHWERVASEQLSALDELGTQVNSTAAELHAEREAHGRTGAVVADLQSQVEAMRAEWQGQVAELGATLAQEREEYQRTLEDERHTTERARAEQIAQHREQVERIQAEASAAIDALQQRLVAAQAQGETLQAELGATRADVVRLSDDLEAIRGEVVAANSRAREADDLRARAEQRVEELTDELAYVRSEVMGTAGGRKKGRGLFGGARKPAMVKAAEKPSRAAVSNNDVAAPPADPDVEDIIERRLFGSV